MARGTISSNLVYQGFSFSIKRESLEWRRDPPKMTLNAKNMTPQNYMDEIVLPTVAEFKNEPRSRRRAYLACVVTFHLKDHLKAAGEKGIEQTMRAAGHAFDVVRGVCNGTKHFQTDQTHLIQFAAGNDWDRPPAAIGQLAIGVSRIGDAHGGREIGTGPQRCDIYSAVKDTLAAFCSSYASHLGTTDLTGV
jgi:hypothetical protein